MEDGRAELQPALVEVRASGVAIAELARAKRVELQLRDGRRVTFPDGVDAEWLATVLSRLEGPSC